MLSKSHLHFRRVTIAALTLAGPGLLLAFAQACVCNLQVELTAHQNPRGEVLAADRGPAALTLEDLGRWSDGISQLWRGGGGSP